MGIPNTELFRSLSPAFKEQNISKLQALNGLSIYKINIWGKRNKGWDLTLELPVLKEEWLHFYMRVSVNQKAN